MSGVNSGKTITHDEINALPLKAFMGQIVLITKSSQLPEVFAEIKQHTVVGFDTETKPAFVKGQVFKVALLQLAIPGKVFLIRLNQTDLTKEITDFFEDENIVKAGVGLRDDIKTLHRLGKFTPAGFAELSTMARETGLEVESVKKLTALLLGFRISKGAQTSNWEAEQLNEKQIVYAATDAWVCLEIYKKLKKGE
jgi:ribonuclease D